MQDNKGKEQWISDIMNSTAGMHKASPEAGFYERVKEGLGRSLNTTVMNIPVKQWAAAAAVLLALNIGSIIYSASRDRSAGNTNTGNPLAAEMQLETTYNY